MNDRRSTTSWTEEDTRRFTELRLKVLGQLLAEADQQELDLLQARFEAEEAQQLAPAFERMKRERLEIQTALKQRESENARLAQLLEQQEQLVTDAKQWIDEFETRHRAIYQQYTFLKRSGALSTA